MARMANSTQNELDRPNSQVSYSEQVLTCINDKHFSVCVRVCNTEAQARIYMATFRRSFLISPPLYLSEGRVSHKLLNEYTLVNRFTHFIHSLNFG